MNLSLSPVEKKVVKGLKDVGGKGDAEEVAKASGLKVNQVLSSIASLASKGVISFSRIAEKVFILTEEGKRFLKGGTPERKLLNLIKKRGEISTKELKSLKVIKKKDVSIALKWLKEKGWVSIEKVEDENIMRLTDAGKYVLDHKTDLEKFLDMFKDRERIPDKELIPEFGTTLKEALERKVVKEKEISHWKLELTKEGYKILEEKERAEITRLTKNIIESGDWKRYSLKPYNIKVKPPELYIGKKHPYTIFLEYVRKLLIGMGFVEVKGNYVEPEFWNFDALFQPQDHPAREIHDSYILKNPKEANIKLNEYVERVRRTHEDGWRTGSVGWGYRWDFKIARRLILRSQTTVLSIRNIASGAKPPYKMFAIGKVFRPDVIDRTHSTEFYQCEGIVLDRNLNMKHLLGYLKTFAEKLGFKRVKFKPGYFPFTEPSVETFVYHPKLGWIEVLGAGLFRPEVLIPAGVDYPEVQCLAWGIGIDRLATIKLGIDDIRYLHSQDLKWLREKSLGFILRGEF
ncbi:MAG: phenylalanine--tRNA ligase subunit alpha [Candidatus Asgardarchaeia archaeon]